MSGALRMALLFGGPSDERGISAGSLKPWVTYLEASPRVELEVLFFDRDRAAQRLPRRYFSTNTCEDFESQLDPADALSEAQLDELLRAQELVVPLIHGAFGEDGEIQARLDQLDVPYLFSGPTAMAASLHKGRCHARLADAGLGVPRHVVLALDEWTADPDAAFARTGGLGERVAVKPLSAGSSHGVSLVARERGEVDQALARAFELGPEALVEEFLAGPEFSVIVLELGAGAPVALAPTEIETKRELYDTRSKYLHGEGARLHTPFRDAAAVAPIRAAAVRAFQALGLRGMARLDGFDLAGGPAITDVNGVSGFNFSSFVFLQTAHTGLGHAELIERLVRAALPAERVRELGPLFPVDALPGASRRVHVLFGGTTSERQVSRQSGIFVGLCLLARGFDVRFVLQDPQAGFTAVGLFYALHHDVEEIHALVGRPQRRAEIERLARVIGAELGLDAAQATHHLAVGETGDLAAATRNADFVFLGLHGGAGEDGTVQAALEALGKPYNGPGPESSALCADKAATLAHIDAQQLPGVRVPRQRVLTRSEMLAWLRAGDAAWAERWESLKRELGSTAVVCKPRADGCSTGVKLLRTAEELARYVRAILALRAELAAGELGPASRVLKLPVPPPRDWLLEEALIEADPPPLPKGDWNAANLRSWFTVKRFVELTCAVLEQPDGSLLAAEPSLTIAAAGELSLEEKFQQGTGTNLELGFYAEPEELVTLRERFASIARACGLRGYGRLDAFWDRAQQLLIPIEINTLPGLTEATVFYAQMHAATGKSPSAVLEQIVERGLAAAADR